MGGKDIPGIAVQYFYLVAVVLEIFLCGFIHASLVKVLDDFQFTDILFLDGFLDGFGDVDDPVVGWSGKFDLRDLHVTSEVADVTVGYRSCEAGAVRFGTQGTPCAFLHGLWRRFCYTSVVFY